MSIIVGHLLWTFPYFKNLFTLLCYYGGGTGALLMVNDMNDAETRVLEVLEFLSRIVICIIIYTCCTVMAIGAVEFSREGYKIR